MRVTKTTLIAFVGAGTLALFTWVFVWRIAPENTEEMFCRLVRDGRITEANELINLPPGWTFRSDTEVEIRGNALHKRLVIPDWPSCLLECGFEPNGWTIADFLRGRRRFHSHVLAAEPIGGLDGWPDDFVERRLTIECSISRGGISTHPLTKSSITATVVGSFKDDEAYDLRTQF